MRLLCLTVVLALGVSVSAQAEDPFFKGKTIRFIVGFSPGGGFDGYSRAVARHIGKHIPGNPGTLVQNMAAAGSLVAANYLYNKAKPDGLTIGNWIGNLILQQYLGAPGVRFDAQEFEWIGAPVKIHNVCVFTKDSGITDLKNWRASKTPVKMGASAPGSTTADIPRLLMKYSDLPIQLVEGFGGVSRIRLAAESGEVSGGCWSWEGTKPSWGPRIKSGEIAVVLQAVDSPHADLPGVPLGIAVMKSDEGRQMMKAAVHDTGAVNRPFSLPPGTPKERVGILRQAFDATMKDPAFLADAKKSRLDIDPLTGAEVEAIVRDFQKIPPSTLATMKEVLLPQG